MLEPKEENSGFIEDSPFNMAKLFYDELHVLRELKSRAYILGDPETYKNALDEIYTNITFKLSADEQEEIENLFIESRNYERHPAYKSKLKIIDKKLMFLMHKYKMIFPRVQSKGLNTARKQYGL